MATFRVDDDFVHYIKATALIELLQQCPPDSEIGIQRRPIVTGHLDVIDGSPQGWLLGIIDLGEETIEKNARWEALDVGRSS